ncbi:hypothetical protein GCM10010530_76310 [Kribbella aluminosa]
MAATVSGMSPDAESVVFSIGTDWSSATTFRFVTRGFVGDIMPGSWSPDAGNWSGSMSVAAGNLRFSVMSNDPSERGTTVSSIPGVVDPGPGVLVVTVRGAAGCALLSPGLGDVGPKAPFEQAVVALYPSASATTARHRTPARTCRHPPDTRPVRPLVAGPKWI